MDNCWWNIESLLCKNEVNNQLYRYGEAYFVHKTQLVRA